MLIFPYPALAFYLFVYFWSVNPQNEINDEVEMICADQVALPDFNAGAMENWGLITYRETALLYDSDVSSNGNKERVATIISHELAHMVPAVLSETFLYFQPLFLFTVHFIAIHFLLNELKITKIDFVPLNDGLQKQCRCKQRPKSL